MPIYYLITKGNKTILKQFKQIVTLENSLKLSIISYTSDFEKGLTNE